MLAGARELRIYENGVGAINLPLTPAQIGVQATRSTHPLFLRMLTELLRLIFDCEFEITLPFSFSTKGEMCGNLNRSPWGLLATKTVSCDGFPSRRLGGEHCGTCTSCILRRLSLFAGGFEEGQVSDLYRSDVVHGSSGIPEEQLRPLADMLTQVNRMRFALRSAEPWINLVSEFPEIVAALEGFSDLNALYVKERILGLYSRYCREWNEFPARPPCWALAA